MSSLEIPRDNEVYLLVTSKAIGPVLILGPVIILFLFFGITGLIFMESWWDKMLFSLMLPFPVIWMIILLEGGFINGKRQCIISSKGFTYMDPQSRIGKWLDKHLQFGPT